MDSFPVLAFFKFILASEIFQITALIILCFLFIFLRRQRNVIARMRLSEERFRQIADNTRDWIWETDQYGKYIYSSRAIREILGYEPDEVVDKMYFYDFCFPEERQRMRERSLEMARNGETSVFEVGRRQHKDGHEVILEIRGFARFDPTGKLVGYRGVDRDVTELKRKEQRAEFLARFPSEDINHIMRIDNSGKLIYANKASQPLLDSLNIKIGDRMPDGWLDIVSRTFANNQPDEFEVTLNDRILLFHVTPVVGEHYTNIYGIDITDRKKMQIELERSKRALEEANRDLAANERVLRKMLEDMERINRELKETQDELIQTQKMAAVGSLSSGIAHEIKNPLAIIQQGIERIEKQNPRMESKEKIYVDMIKNAAVRANKIVTSLLTFSRTTHIKLVELNIHTVIGEAVNLVENELRVHNIEMRFDLLKDAPMVKGDSIAIEQVFFALFTNAIDAMPGGGKITVSTRLAEENGRPLCVVEVSDTGRGIDEKNIPFIFDPFFTTKAPGKGTGLGLSTAYLIMERHNGKIGVKSTNREGTTFIIKLPVMDKAGI